MGTDEAGNGRHGPIRYEQIINTRGERVLVPIMQTHHRAAFEAWYAADRSFPKTAVVLGMARDHSLRIWSRQFDWHNLADERDLEAERIATKKAIKRRAEMIERHRQGGALMVHRATQFFRNSDSVQTPIERTADAINAMAKGIEIERTAESLPAWVFEVLEADDETLATIIRQAAAAAADEQSSGSDREESVTATGGDEYARLDGGDDSRVTDAEWEDNG